MGVNNLTYKETVEKIEIRSQSLKILKRLLRKSEYDDLQHTIRKRIYNVRNEVNILLSLVHAHKSARKLYAQNQRLLTNFTKSVASECKCKNNIKVNHDSINRNTKLRNIIKKLANKKGVTDIVFNTEETNLIDSIIGTQNWSRSNEKK